MTEKSELELVLRSQAGNRPAFEELVHRTARWIYARLYLETGRRDRTEDLCQETYLIAWRSIRQLTEVEGFRPWLVSIARTAAIDALRREGRKKRGGGTQADQETLESLADARSHSPPQRLEAEESRQRVLALLRSMPEEYRLPLMLRYLHGSDYQTISRELGLTNGSLRGLLHRGMALLRDKATQAGLTV